MRITRPPQCTSEKRARIRAFFADGVNKSHISWTVEGLPTMLHLSLFFIFLSLLIFCSISTKQFSAPCLVDRALYDGVSMHHAHTDLYA